jgi:Fe-S-cluster containining protein
MMPRRRQRPPQPGPEPEPETTGNGAAPAGATLNFAAARRSPCEGCEAWCCSNLSLPEFRADDFEGLDWARYLLNFPGIRILLTASGRFIPYWRQTCRHFDEEGHLCKVHGTDLQPHICVQYNPFTCFYRTTFPAQENEEQVWVDRRRFERILTGVRVDEARETVVLPPFDLVRRAVEPVPLEPLPEAPDLAGEPAAPDGGAGDRRRIPLRFGDRQVTAPCEGCAAYCCTRLVVPVGKPPDAGLVDYFRYALGFPGVELVVGAESWSLALPATCRHLHDGRCAVFGSDERPLRCEYYDAWNCNYRATFAPGGEGDARVRFDELPALLAILEFDDRGQLLRLPSPAEVAAATRA